MCLSQIPIRVIFFAAAREQAGITEEVVHIPLGSTLEQLCRVVVTRRPGVARLGGRCALAVNCEYVTRAADGTLQYGKALKAGDEVAYIPPVSGG